MQNTTGQIHEEDVMSGRGYIAQSTPFCPHDTTAKSVAMEMTLMESAVSEPFFVTNTNQVSIIISGFGYFCSSTQ